MISSSLGDFSHSHFASGLQGGLYIYIYIYIYIFIYNYVIIQCHRFIPLLCAASKMTNEIILYSLTADTHLVTNASHIVLLTSLSIFSSSYCILLLYNQHSKL